MEKLKKIHFTGIDSTQLPDLAITLHQAGHTVTVSENNISESARHKLLKYNLLHVNTEWKPEAILPALDAVLVSAHIPSDNVELKKALGLGLHIYSFPDYIYSQSKDKYRLVVTGGKEKNQICALVIFMMQHHGRRFDFAVAQPPSGIGDTVKLTDAPIIIIEGQDVISSVFDPSPSFLKFHQHMGVISGIGSQPGKVQADSLKQLEQFADAMPKGGVLIYCELDPVVKEISKKERPDVLAIPYGHHPSVRDGNREFPLGLNQERIPLALNHKEHLRTISGALEVMKKIGIPADLFYKALPGFPGFGN